MDMRHMSPEEKAHYAMQNGTTYTIESVAGRGGPRFGDHSTNWEYNLVVNLQQNSGLPTSINGMIFDASNPYKYSPAGYFEYNLDSGEGRVITYSKEGVNITRVDGKGNVSNKTFSVGPKVDVGSFVSNKGFTQLPSGVANNGWHIVRGDGFIGADRMNSTGDGLDWDMVRFDLGSNVEGNISDYSIGVLADNLFKSGDTRATISSAHRDPYNQARVMFNNLEKRGVQYSKNMYGAYGDKIVDAYVSGVLQQSLGIGNSDNPNITNMDIRNMMQQTIINLGAINVSRHGANFGELNVIDIAPSTISSPSKFLKALKGDSRIDQKRLFSPYTRPKDPAFHIEIGQ